MYGRYIDDVIIIYNGSQSRIDSLLHYLNKQEIDIKFIIEDEQNQSINLQIAKLNSKYTENPLPLTPPYMHNHTTHTLTKWQRIIV